MLNDLQYYVSAFVQLTVASTFGLALAIGVAGVSHSKHPLLCKDCVAQFAIVIRA